jgi:hypothetical protein
VIAANTGFTPKDALVSMVESAFSSNVAEKGTRSAL